jgi:hypothetical protein
MVDIRNAVLTGRSACGGILVTHRESRRQGKRLYRNDIFAAVACPYATPKKTINFLWLALPIQLVQEANAAASFD